MDYRTKTRNYASDTSIYLNWTVERLRYFFPLRQSVDLLIADSLINPVSKSHRTSILLHWHDVKDDTRFITVITNLFVNYQAPELNYWENGLGFTWTLFLDIIWKWRSNRWCNEPRIGGIDKNTLISTFMLFPNGRRKFDMLWPLLGIASLMRSAELCLRTVITDRITTVIESVTKHLSSLNRMWDSFVLIDTRNR